MDVDELRRQHFAIRSFTESVDEEWALPPAEGHDEAPDMGESFGGGMRESSTTDTIIEVVRFKHFF